MDVKGIVKVVGETEEIGEKKFKKRLLVLEIAENPQYPQLVSFEAKQAKCDLLSPLMPGDEVTVHFNLDGREWTNKEGKVQYFNTLSIWKLEVVSKAAPVSSEEPPF